MGSPGARPTPSTSAACARSSRAAPRTSRLRISWPSPAAWRNRPYPPTKASTPSIHSEGPGFGALTVSSRLECLLQVLSHPLLPLHLIQQVLYDHQQEEDLPL